ncbi:hypothetical protein KF840_04810 [bacterium]|nr:hypothetical protein [bacterium]
MGDRRRGAAARRSTGRDQGERERPAVAATLAWAFGLATLVHLVCVACGFYGVSWDEAGRVLDAARWRADPRLLEATTWLPLHRIVIGSALAIHPDLFVTPRVVTFLCGLGVLAALTWLAAELFHDPRITRTTALLGALFTPRVVLALTPLTSTMFSAIVLAAMAALARWLARPTRRWLMLAALAFALSTTIRFEGWMFAAAFGIAVLAAWWTDRRRVGLAELLAVGVIVSAFPLFWVGLHLATDGAEGLFAGAGTQYAAWGTVLRKSPLAELLIVNAATLNLIGVVAAVTRARATARARAILFVAMMPLAFTTAALLVGRRAQSGPAWRMVDVWSLLLLPFTADLIVGVRERWPRAARPVNLVAVGGLCLLYLFGTCWVGYQSRWAVPAVERALGGDLNRLLASQPAGTRVLIDTSRYSYLNVLVSSQRPQAFIANATPERLDDPAAVLAADRPLPLADLQARDIRFVAVRAPTLRERVARTPALRHVGDYGDWSLYALP